MFRRAAQPPPPSQIDKCIAMLFREAELIGFPERKIWCFAQIYFLSVYAGISEIPVSNATGKLITICLDVLERYYGMSGKSDIEKMLCYDIGKDMMRNYKGEQDRSTFYCNEEQRKQFRAAVNAQGLLVRSIDGQPANLKVMKNSDVEPIFVVGKDGALYLCYADQLKSMITMDKHFHHSSFFGGKRVLCGGMIHVINGQVVEINKINVNF